MVKFQNANSAAPRSRDQAPRIGVAGARPDRRYRRNLFISLLVFVCAYTLVYFPSVFDTPLERWINSYADRSRALDVMFFDLDAYFIFTGILLVSLIWYCWFERSDLDRRARLLVGVLACVAAGVISRFSQHVLPSHPRPFYDPTLGFHLPSVLSQAPLNTWNSFPSDHAAVFFGLVAVICLVHPRLGLLVFVWIAFAESARAYLGAHYPSDLIGGAALGSALVWSAQASRVVSAGRRLAAYERSSPAFFHLCAFFLSYEIATLFQDIRNVLGGVAIFRLVLGAF